MAGIGAGAVAITASLALIGVTPKEIIDFPEDAIEAHQQGHDAYSWMASGGKEALEGVVRNQKAIIDERNIEKEKRRQSERDEFMRRCLKAKGYDECTGLYEDLQR